MSTNATGSVLDERPKPWVVALGVDEDSDVGAALARLGGTIHHCDTLDAVRQADFDFMVCCRPPLQAHPKLHILEFMRSDYPLTDACHYDDYASPPLRVSVGAYASRFRASDVAVELGLKPLIDRTILQNLPPASIYEVLKPQRSIWDTAGSSGPRNVKFIPILSEWDGHALAGFQEHAEGGRWLLLPGETTDHGAWVDAMFRLWKASRPDAFPTGSTEPAYTWMTFSERQAENMVREHQDATARIMEEREAKLQKLRDEAASISEVARGHEQRLLFGTGDELVDAVRDALTRLGFEVSDSDEQAFTQGTAKREDLQVRVGSDPGWTALVEVKGKARGAAVRDVIQLAKAGAIYASKNGRLPDGEWYVINANNTQPPSDRPVPLGTSKEDVDHHAKVDNLVVIDTRELFVLLRAVDSGVMEPALARKSLIAATGIYSAPKDPSDQ